MSTLKKQGEKKARVDLLYKQAVRRLGRHQLQRGFAAWQEQWWTDARCARLLTAATGRLRRPHAAAAFTFWRDDAAALVKKMASKGWESKLTMIQSAGEQALRHGQPL